MVKKKKYIYISANFKEISLQTQWVSKQKHIAHSQKKNKWKKSTLNCHRGFSRPQWQICGRKICPFPQFTANFITFHEKS